MFPPAPYDSKKSNGNRSKFYSLLSISLLESILLN
jgi:hypothetical protein